MELPKNITQVGESDQRCKVYAEDYVISYIKQMNRQAEGKNIAIALYGIRKEEENISYIFFYGAAKVNSIQKEVRHLSQAQSQEVEKLKKRFFPEYQFMGYRLLDGDMIEGFHVCDQGTCRYISGYACFYEKNDAMLAYMLDSRKEEVPPETVDQEKFDRVRQRQEERRAQYRSSVAGATSRKEESERREDYAGEQEGVYTGSRERTNEQEGTYTGSRERTNELEGDRTGSRERTYIRGREGIRAASQRGTRSGSRESGRIRGWNASRIKSGNSSEKAGSVPRQTKPQATPSLRMMRAAVAGIFILLCVLGITSAKDMGSTEDIQAAARQLIAEFTEKKIPDASEEADNANQSDTLVAEDKLTDAIQQENAARQSEESAKQSEQSESGQPSQQTDQTAQSTQPSQSEGSQSAQQTDQAAQSTQPSQSEQTEQSTQPGQTAPTTDTQPDQQTTQSADSQSAQQSSQAVSEQTTQSVSQQASAPVTYTIKKGDTLTAISIAQYGTDEMVQAICDLNQIKDPDDIRFGQKILLP